MNELNADQTQVNIPNSTTDIVPEVVVPTLEDVAKTNQINEYIQKIKSVMAANLQAERNKYYSKKKTKVSMRKKSQKINLHNDKKFLKREAKRQSKLAAKK